MLSNSARQGSFQDPRTSRANSSRSSMASGSTRRTANRRIALTIASISHHRPGYERARAARVPQHRSHAAPPGEPSPLASPVRGAAGRYQSLASLPRGPAGRYRSPSALLRSLRAVPIPDSTCLPPGLLGRFGTVTTPKPAPPVPLGRIPVLNVEPTVQGGRWAAKATAGEAVPIRATVFREGHDAVAATAVLIAPDGTEHTRAPMVDVSPGNDLFEATVVPDSPGRWTFRVEGWSDPYGT